KSVSYGAIHAIHTWFARRPLSACRAAVFGALADAPDTEDARRELMELLSQAAPDKAVREDKALVEALRQRVRDAYDGRPPRLLDPFGGGGSIPLEAARLGCEVETLDINPVAVLTMLATVDYPIRYAQTRFPLPPRADDALMLGDRRRTGTLARAVEDWGAWLHEWVRPQLAPYYPQEDDGAVPVAYLWAKTVPCTGKACGGEIPLVAHRWLSRRKGKTPVAYALEPTEGGALRVRILTGKEATESDPAKGTTTGGAARCPHCGQVLTPTKVKAAFGRGSDGRMLLAVALTHPDETGTRFRAATDEDQAVFQAAADALQRQIGAHDDPFFPLVPDEAIDATGGRWINVLPYNVKSWGQMHNARQALALVTYCRGVASAHTAMQEAGAEPEAAAAVALYLALTVSRMVLRLSEGSRWNSRRDTIEAATAGHRLPILWDYAEASPLSGGSGSWASTLRWMLPALKNIVAADGRPAHVAWGDARHLPYDDASFDAIVTDPPYYDSVGYSYLSDMQYVWLHRALRGIMPDRFPTPLTPKAAELTATAGRHKNAAVASAAYEEGMVQALAELRRVVKPDGLAVVMFANSQTEAWETLVSALIRAGFQITASWPVDTETASRRDWLGGAM
ncbi:MAG: DUF1156 domain-containing protein, partial [Chloroflexi bacterium]|nr:DUF1156 domain-containing protein [Chloroflexota bacterium]